MRKFAIGLCLGSCLAFGSSVTYAAVGQISCASSTGTMVSAAVSYYDLGVTSSINIGSQSSGAGAGKVTFNPLEIHTPLGNFQQFLRLAETGQTFTTCTLTSQVGGNRMVYDLRLLLVSSADAVAGNPEGNNDEPAAYTDVKLSYGAIHVQANNAP